MAKIVMMSVEKLKKEDDEIPTVKARTVLWFLVFFGFAVNYMIRINLNIAIVDMVRTNKNSTILQSQDCSVPTSVIVNFNRTTDVYQEENEDFNSTTRSMWSTTEPSSLLDNTDEVSIVPEDPEASRFPWNEYQQGLVLGAFFWLHWLTQVPGGILAGKYGTKLVFGLSNFAGVLCCFALPTAAYLGYKELIAVRLFQGIVSGFCWPAMHNMTAKWIPPNERSKFVTAYLGSSVGAALTYPMCGLIMDYCGWELVFHVSGLLGTLWFIMWWLFVFDSPTQHPRIETAEKDYIVASLGQSVAKKQAPVPWAAILTSIPVWMNILAQFGGIWGLFTLMTHAPTYFKFIHGVNIKLNGFLSGLPHFLRMAFAYIFSLFGDFLLSTNRMSRTNVRKLATAVCCIGQGFCMLALAYSGCSYHSAIIFLTMATAIHGAVSTGPLASLVDISPNYASITLGLQNTCVAIVGFLTPTVVGFLTYQNQTVSQWQKVFWIATAMLMIAGVTYVILSKSELEPWNSPDSLGSAATDAEMQSLKPEEREKQASSEGRKEKEDDEKTKLNKDSSEETGKIEN